MSDGLFVFFAGVAEIALVVTAIINLALGIDLDYALLLLQGEWGTQVRGPLDDQEHLVNLLQVRFWVSIVLLVLGFIA